MMAPEQQQNHHPRRSKPPRVRRGSWTTPILKLLLLCIINRSVMAFTAIGPSVAQSPALQSSTSRRICSSYTKESGSKTRLCSVTNHHKKEPRQKKRNLPRKIARIYTDYAKRLWSETSPEARRIIAKNRVANTLRQAQNLIENEKNLDHSDIPLEDRTVLVEACDSVLKSMEKASQEEERRAKALEAQAAEEVNGSSSSTINGDEANQTGVSNAPKRARRSITFGALMGLAVACMVFSGNYIFTGLFMLMTVLGQLEYYRMVINTGVYPARRISVIGASFMFLAALFTPDLHQICLPMWGLWAMVWFLTMKRTVTTIPEIATTFTGMFYLGYVPSFWVRTRVFHIGESLTRVAPLTQPMLRFLETKGKVLLPAFIPKYIVLPITTGAIFIFWTWLSIAFSDVGAYFVGRKYGKTKLGSIAPAAGATSPNKTVEGVIGGCTVSAILAIFGAWVQRWPLPILTGGLHGLVLGMLGLLGDLTASMLKRDAGLKDFGDLLPEHGGIVDRVDSFIWAAPYSWLVCVYVIPFLKNWLH